MNELRKALDEYLSIRRKLGFKLQRAGKLLHDFVLFIEKEGGSFITTKLALRWATKSLDCQTAWSATRLGIVRGFAKYLSVMDPRTEVPSQELLPYRYHRRPPYIYSNDEVIRLIKAAKQLQSPLGLRAAIYSTVFGLLAVTGMRISESIGLNRKDVDLINGIYRRCPNYWNWPLCVWNNPKKECCHENQQQFARIDRGILHGPSDATTSGEPKHH